jgi:hypothetical protein
MDKKQFIIFCGVIALLNLISIGFLIKKDIFPCHKKKNVVINLCKIVNIESVAGVLVFF